MVNQYYRRIGALLIAIMVLATSVFGFQKSAHAEIRQAEIDRIIARSKDTPKGGEDPYGIVTEIIISTRSLNTEERAALRQKITFLFLTNSGNGNLETLAGTELALPLPDPQNTAGNKQILEVLQAQAKTEPPGSFGHQTLSPEAAKLAAGLSPQDRAFFDNLRLNARTGVQEDTGSIDVGKDDTILGTAADYWNGKCGFGTLDNCVAQIIAFLGNLAAYMAGSLLYLAAGIFGFAIKISILEFHKFADLKVIASVWSIGRDLANMFFIFILLYAAIGDIVDIGKASIQKNLTKILIVAIFINFSLPIARAFIDANNILAVEVYKKMVPDSLNGNPAMFVVENLTPKSGLGITELLTGKKPPGEGESKLTTTTAIVSSLGAVIVTLATAFTFLAGAVLLLYRAIALIFILALSSLAFFAQLIPRTEKKYGEWWSGLINNAVFAPAYMLLLYFVLRVMGESNIGDIIAQFSGSGALAAGLSTAVYYMILLGLLNGAMMVASEFNIEGNKWVSSYVDKARDYVAGSVKTVTGVNFAQRQAVNAAKKIGSGIETVGNIPGRVAGAAGNYALRNTVGAAARYIADTDMAKNFASGNGRGIPGALGKFVGPTASAAARDAIAGVGAGFGLDEEKKAAKTRMDAFKGDPERQAGVLANMIEVGNSVAAQEAYNSLSAEEKVRVENAGTASQRAAIGKLKAGYLAQTTSTQGRTPAGANAKKEKELKKAQETLNKEKMVEYLAGGKQYEASAHQELLKKVNSEELGKILSGVTNPQVVINDLQLNQFKNFVINETNLGDTNVVKTIKDMYSSLTGVTPLAAPLKRFVQGNIAAKENLGIPIPRPLP